jgi:hypothetical protein
MGGEGCPAFAFEYSVQSGTAVGWTPLAAHIRIRRGRWRFRAGLFS